MTFTKLQEQVLRIRTPFGMFRVKAQPAEPLSSAVQKVRLSDGDLSSCSFVHPGIQAKSELKSKNQTVSDPQLFRIPPTTTSNDPLPLSTRISELRFRYAQWFLNLHYSIRNITIISYRDGQMLELKGNFESTIKVIPESEQSIFDLPAIVQE